MMQVSVANLANSLPFELTVADDGATAAPVAALGQLNNWTGTYRGNPLLACAEALEALAQEIKEWKPSQSAFIPQYGTLAQFAHFGKFDWFRTETTLGSFRIEVYVWLTAQAKLLRMCLETPSDTDIEQAKKLLQLWARIISWNRNR